MTKVGLKGLDGSSLWAVGTEGKAIPELLFATFQMTFAAITAALVVGALVERVRFSAKLLFGLLFVTIVYAPIAHMVWASGGLILQTGAIDFAGGTVVHVNAGIAGLAGVWFAWPRLGYLKKAMPPHSLALVLVGTGLLWVGRFGFNAGSALEANGLAAIGVLNTFIAPAAGVLACYAFISTTKNRLKLDDSLDVFGIHGLGGIVGSIGTAIVALPALGGHGADDYALGAQLGKQLGAVALAIGWSGIGSATCFGLAKLTVPLRHDDDAQREGLDLADHGERAYNL